MEYEDFEVRVRSDREDGFEVEAVPIPSLARVIERFEIPFQPEEVEALLRTIEAEMESSVRRDSIGSEEVGRRLFAASWATLINGWNLFCPKSRRDAGIRPTTSPPIVSAEVSGQHLA